jgi:hypothetical protein
MNTLCLALGNSYALSSSICTQTRLNLRSGFHPLRTVLQLLNSLLRIHTAVRSSAPGTKIDLCLPSRNLVFKHKGDVFERLSCGFREQEECVDRHGGAKDAKDDVHFPLDVDKGGGHEVGECEVEYPIGRCSGIQMSVNAWGEDVGGGRVLTLTQPPCRGRAVGKSRVGTPTKRDPR